MKLSINDLKVSLAEKSVNGLNALVGGYYESNIQWAIDDMNAYSNSSCNAISWFGDITTKKLEKFYALAEHDLDCFLTNWVEDGLSFSDMGLDEQQIACLVMYGLNPQNLPKHDKEYLVWYVQDIRRTVILGWIDTVINDFFEQSQEQAA